MNRNITPKYLPKRTEKEIRAFWSEKKAYERSREKRSHGEDIYLLDSVHGIGDSENNTLVYSMILKDSLIRYMRMRGYNVRDVPGTDAYSGEIEYRALQSMGLEPDEIGENAEEYVRECRRASREFMNSLAEDLSEMGIWMDWRKSYTPVDSKYMEGVWFMFRELNSKSLIGRFRGISQWCPSCRSFISRQQIRMEKEWKKGVYAKFRLKDRSDTYLAVWFSEPWKLTATLALEVSSSKRYSIIEIRGGREKIIVGSGEMENVLRDCGIKDFRKAGEIGGEKLIGQRYIHPLFGSTVEEDDIIDIGMMESEDLNIDIVLDGKSTGRTGIRPVVPAHSNYDLNLAERNGIQALTPVSDTGELGDRTGKYAGFGIFDSDSIIIRDLMNSRAALSAYDILESTPYCKKCGSRLIPMISEEWSFRPSSIGDAVESAASEVEWVPPWMMGVDYEWMEQMMPIPISRKGYWGVPMPVWTCSCGHTEVLGSTGELEKNSPEFKKGMGIHRPWVDRYTLKCPKCGGSMKRVEEILTPDFSYMAASWAQLHYPGIESEFKRWWPADLVVEPLSKSRTWIYSQMAASVALFDRPPFKRVIGTGKVGISEESIDIKKALVKYGADIVRYTLLSSEKPWHNHDLRARDTEPVRRLFNRLWNIHRFLALHLSIFEFKAEEVSIDTVHEYGMAVDKWMLSYLESSKERYMKSMDSGETELATGVLESLVDTVSTWYIRAVRERIKSGDMERREVLSAYRTLYETVIHIIRMLAPFAPHISERMYMNLNGSEVTVHSENIETPNRLLIDRNLDVRMEIAMDIIRSGRKARRNAGIPIRWPVNRIVVKAASKEVIEAVDLFRDFIKDELNVKVIETVAPAQEWGEMILEVQPNPDAIGLVYRQWSSRIAVMLRNRPAKRIREEIKKGEYYLGIEGQMVKIEPNMVKFVSSLPDYVVEERFLDGSVYLDIRRDERLLIEGRMREIVRRVQDMRKDLALGFRDYIDLYISGNEEIEEAVMEWGEEMAEITHAREIVLTNEEGIEGEYLVEWYIEGEPVIIGIEPLYWEEMMTALTRIPGINRQKAESIFDAGYTNLALLLEASEEELASIPGISSGLARKIRSNVRKNFSDGAVLIRKDEIYECGACGALFEEVPESCPKCHLSLHLKEEEPEPEKEEEKEHEERAEKSGDDFIKKMAKIKGIGPSRARLLYESGYRSEEDLKKAGMDKVAETKRMSRALTERLFKELGIEESGAPAPEKKKGGAEGEKPQKVVEEMSEKEFIKALSGIRGLGPSRIKRIYRAGYHSMEDLKNASVDDIAGIPRMSRALAETLKEFVGIPEDEEEEEFMPEKGGLYIFSDARRAYSSAGKLPKDTHILCLTRDEPGSIKKKKGLDESRVMQVSGSAPDALRPNELDKIALTLDKWMAEKGSKALLMDVLDQIISENSFESTMRFLDYLKDEGRRKDFFVILSFNLNSLPDEEKKILREKADYLD